ncbi:cadherin EGF LAG seven-pass G-type receptor 1-like, partial [Centroberyx affinis]|uniref:cadherin EGF LAG seven-pass G-type receptor 1-like n=1 Tax=Centroberyx affinis TaxID=166261 RepID=UPI003A5C5530
FFGSGCVDACQLNPCQHTSSCVHQPRPPHGYRCHCGNGYHGDYCQHRASLPCARGWWGGAVCGPCNCDVTKGFNRDCNQTTGECRCKDNYFRPEGSDACFPCECFQLGAASRSCDARTGQCQCRTGVIGRQCNRCDNPYAEVTAAGCVVVYEGCPRAFEAGIWWPKTQFGQPAAMKCPKGSTGTAVRHCSDQHGWLPPDLFNCTSLPFAPLRKEEEELQRNASRMDGERSRRLAGMLRIATDQTAALRGSDVRTACSLLSRLLRYESQQHGFNMAAMQDPHFHESLVRAGSSILAPDTRLHWDQIQRAEGGAARLLRSFQLYAQNLAQNVRKTYLKPFTILTDNMMSTETTTEVPAVQTDDVTAAGRTESPTASPTASVRRKREAAAPRPPPVAVVIVYRTLGELLPQSYDHDRRSLRLPSRPVINTPVVSTVLYSEGAPPPPPTLQLPLLETEERARPLCVFWNHSLLVNGSGGWSARGCELLSRTRSHISCRCAAACSAAVLMDVSRREHGEVLPLKIITYSTVSSSLVALLITFLLLAILRKLRTNLHSIHKNLVASIFLSELVFLFGINRTENAFVCTLAAILLHYSYMCTFAWMLVESLHIYRMLTEIRNINHGHMRFYYAIGWGVPAVITGLAVGLDPQGYGNSDFCWLSVHDTLIWSIAGPIAVVVMVNIAIFFLAARASCGQTHWTFEKSGAISALRLAFLLLLLLSATWLLGLMAVNSDIISFHYLFAVFSCLQGVCIFFFHCVFNKEVRTNLKEVFTGRKTITEESTSARTAKLTRSLNGKHSFCEDDGLYRTAIGESTASLDRRSRSSSQAAREDSGQKRTTPSSAKKSYYGDGDSSIFLRKRSKREDSDSDSELSLEENSSSYASSRSSDSEDERSRRKQRWNNEREPPHGTPLAETAANHVRPYWPVELPTASESEEPGGGETLRVETKVSVELNGHAPSEKEGGVRGGAPPSSPGSPDSYNQPRRGILKNRVTSPPPLADKNMKNRLREKLSDFPRPPTPSPPTNRGLRPVAGGNGVLIKLLPHPPLSPRQQHNGVTMVTAMLTTTTVNGTEDGHDSESDGSNETSI